MRLTRKTRHIEVARHAVALAQVHAKDFFTFLLRRQIEKENLIESTLT
jgi:hypothetical protein